MVVPDRLNSEYAVVLQSGCSGCAVGVARVLAATGNHFDETVIQPNVRRAIALGARYRISAAPAGPSLSSWRSVTWKNCARTQRCHGVTRIVTISCTDSDDAHWRRPLAQKCGQDWRSRRSGRSAGCMVPDYRSTCRTRFPPAPGVTGGNTAGTRTAVSWRMTASQGS